MRRLARLLFLGALAALVVPSVAQAGHTTDPRTKNMHPLGHIIEPAVLGGFGGGNPDIHTDIAFRGDLAVQGNWDGFSIRDISAPGQPDAGVAHVLRRQPGRRACTATSSCARGTRPPGTPGRLRRGLTCDGQAVPAGFEGAARLRHQQPGEPGAGRRRGAQRAAAGRRLRLRLAHRDRRAGSRERPPDRLQPDLRRALRAIRRHRRRCRWTTRRAPAFLRNEPLARHTLPRHRRDPGRREHDGRARRMACRTSSASAQRAGRIAHRPGVPLHDRGAASTCRHRDGNWHSAAFTWDGETIILGWEPGGGLQAECEATDPAAKKSFFFYDADDGSKLGQWTLPRPQGANENCTLHNYNLVPLQSGRDVMVSGNYQAGTGWSTSPTRRTRRRSAGAIRRRRSGAAPGRRRSAARCRGLPAHGRVVGLLVQRVPLRESHRRGLEHLQAERATGSREADQAPAPEPADTGVLAETSELQSHGLGAASAALTPP